VGGVWGELYTTYIGYISDRISAIFLIKGNEMALKCYHRIVVAEAKSNLN
jgi:hypothetical protein